LHLLIDHSK